MSDAPRPRPGAAAILLGGLAFFATAIVVAVPMAIVHEALFEADYREHAAMFRSGFLEGGEHEPNVTAVWWAHKILFALGVSFVYALARSSLRGPGWRRGAIVGLATWWLIAVTYAGEWTAFALPARIWIGWALDYLVSAAVAGAAMGFVVERRVRANVPSSSV